MSAAPDTSFWRHLLAASTACVSAAAVAQEVPARGPVDDRYFLTLGAYSPSSRTSVRLDAPGGRIGTDVSFEKDLGVSSDVVAGDLTFGVRLGERHRLELEAFAIDRTGSRATSRQIRLGNDTYDVGFQLDTAFDTDVVRLGYAYSIVRDERKEIGLHAGLHVTDISMRVTAALRPVTSATEESAETTAPLPVVGVQGTYRFLEKWTFRGRAQVYRLAAGDYDGEVNHVSLALEHHTLRHFGFGVGLDFFELDLNSNDTGFLGAFKLQFSGPRVFAHTRF